VRAGEGVRAVAEETVSLAKPQQGKSGLRSSLLMAAHVYVCCLPSSKAIPAPPPLLTVTAVSVLQPSPCLAAHLPAVWKACPRQPPRQQLPPAGAAQHAQQSTHSR